MAVTEPVRRRGAGVVDCKSKPFTFSRAAGNWRGESGVGGVEQPLFPSSSSTTFNPNISQSLTQTQIETDECVTWGGGGSDEMTPKDESLFTFAQ